jgi:voltage-gated potassium channel
VRFKKVSVNIYEADKMLAEWKSKINFWFEDIETPIGRAVDIGVVTLVFLVSGIFVIKTYPIPDGFRQSLGSMENFIVGIFVIEYFLRMWSAPSRIKQFFNLYSFIDLIAIAPIFFIGQGYQILRVFRALRFLRLVRFLRGDHFFIRKLSQTHIIVIRIIYILLSIIFVSAGMIFYAENNLPGSQINTFFDAVYFSIVTLTTVGYGDITPVSTYGRFITILIIVSGIVLIPWQIKDLFQHLLLPEQKTEVICKRCGLKYHDKDAKFCKKCGFNLDKTNPN